MRCLEYTCISDEIFTVNEFLSADECETYITLAEQIGFSAAPINTFNGPQVHNDVRNNTRAMLDDPAVSGDLWNRISQYVPDRFGNWRVCGVNERIRFYRYDVGQQFDWHFDGYYQRPNGERSRLTFMVYLNEGVRGRGNHDRTIDHLATTGQGSVVCSSIAAQRTTGRQGPQVRFTHRRDVSVLRNGKRIIPPVNDQGWMIQRARLGVGSLKSDQRTIGSLDWNLDWENGRVDWSSRLDVAGPRMRFT